MKKRIVALFVAAVMLLSLAIPASAVGISDAKKLELAEAIAESAESFKSSYSFSTPVDPGELHEIMMIVYNNNPDFFHLSHQYSYSYGISSVTGKEIAYSVILHYNMDADEYARRYAEVENWKKAVISLTDSSFTEAEYALFFHDYLCENYEYDTDYSIRDLYGFIKYGKGVCQSYTYAYMTLLREVGVEASYAHSTEMNHVWNVVKVDGEWYHVDATWDDPLGNLPGGSGHTYFMKSDNGILSHYAWVSPYYCTSEKYDSDPVFGTHGSFVYTGGKWYSLKSGEIYVSDRVEGNASLYYNDYDNYIIDIIGYGGKVYAVTSGDVRLIVPDGDDVTLYEVTGENVYVNGIQIDRGQDGISGAALSEGNVILYISDNSAGSITQMKLDLDDLPHDDTFPTDPIKPDGGDANEDGSVTLADASLMMKYIASWNVTLNTIKADVDGSGSVTLSDVSTVMKIVAGWSVNTAP